MATSKASSAGRRASDVEIEEWLSHIETPEIRAHKRKMYKKYAKYLDMPIEELQKAVTAEIGEGAFLRALDESRGPP